MIYKMKLYFLNISVLLLVICQPLSADTRYGVSAINSNMERLCYLDNETMTFSESSYDRRGLNVDLPSGRFGNPYPTYLGVDAHGDRILLDVKGAGCVYRLFMSEMTHRTTCRLKIYFDGEDTPAINEKVIDLTQGKIKGFPTPLVHIRNQKGTGIFPTSQHNSVPLPFAHSIRITTDETGEALYQNIQYQLFAPGTVVKSWTPNQDLTHVLDMINQPGIDPKETRGNTKVVNKINVPANDKKTLLDLTGKKQIQSIKFKIPGFTQTNGEMLTDSGVSFTGQSQFTAAINPRNFGLYLKRLYLIKAGMSTEALVFIDGQEVGAWKIPQVDVTTDQQNHWRHSTFYIPDKYTQGKAQVIVTIKNNQANQSLNEYGYTIYSVDPHNVGKRTSEFWVFEDYFTFLLKYDVR